MNFRLKEYGDIHFFHNRTPTFHIISNFKRSLPDTDDLNDLDVIVLNGDVFDRASVFYDDESHDVIEWMVWLLQLCKKRNIKLRVMEGTPSHDWKQSAYFPFLNELYQIGCDVRYVDTLSIEYFPDYDLNFLYVPDEWRTDSLETWKEVQALLKANRLKMVDFAFIHGSFPHQLPPAARNSKEMHRLDHYTSIVRYRIFGAHIHQRSEEEKFLAAGSFDRLSHSDEMDKGHLDYRLINGKESFSFVVNRGAMVYKTIRCKDIDITECLAKIEKVVGKHPEGSHFRIYANRTDPIFSAGGALKLKFPKYHWTFKDALDKENETSAINKTIEGIRQLKRPCLNETNLRPALMDRLRSKHPDQVSLFDQIYEEIVING